MRFICNCHRLFDYWGCGMSSDSVVALIFGGSFTLVAGVIGMTLFFRKYGRRK
jgi:hypothetical protein